MLKKFLGVLIVLGLCITGITQANCSNLSLPSWLNCLNVNTNGTTAQTNSINIDEKANFTMGGHNFAFFNRANDLTKSIAIGRKNGNLNVIVNNPYSYNTTGYFKVEKLNYCTYANTPNASTNCLGSNAPTISYNEFITEVSDYNLSEILYSNSEFNNTNTANFCFGYDGIEKLYCIGPNVQSATMLSAFYTKLDDITGYEVPFTPTNLGTSFFTNSPFNGPTQGGYTQLPMCYTIQQKIDSFPSNYNIEMCYSSNKIWSGNQFVTVTPKSMLELRPTYDEYIEDVNLYQNYCGNNVANTQACGEAFSGKEEKWSIINKLYNQGTQTILRSYDYCYLQLNFTEEQKRTRTNCTMGTGLQHGSGITTDDIIEDMQNHQIVIITPNGNTVYSGFWNNGSGDNEANLSYDGIINSMQSVRGKLTNIFYYRTGVTGIIPDYITRILLLIVLFAIFKK